MKKSVWIPIAGIAAIIIAGASAAHFLLASSSQSAPSSSGRLSTTCVTGFNMKTSPQATVQWGSNTAPNWVASGNGNGDELRYTLTNKTSNNVPVEGATIEISSGGHVFSTVTPGLSTYVAPGQSGTFYWAYAEYGSFANEPLISEQTWLNASCKVSSWSS
jgi:hypothetical protein